MQEFEKVVWPETLLDALRASRTDAEGYRFVQRDGTIESLSYAELNVRAFALADRLAGMGVERGDRVGLLVPRNEDFAELFWAVVAAGAIAIPLSPPPFLQVLDEHMGRLFGILNAARCTVLVTDRRLKGLMWNVRSLVPSLRRVITASALRRSTRLKRAAILASATDVALIQFTSGSTSQPRGVVVRNGALLAHAAAIRDAMGLDRMDRKQDNGVSWLPLYHDMGMIGFLLLPLMMRGSVTFIHPLHFLRDPNVWMETVHRQRASLTFAPNFALSVAVRRVTEERLERWNLGCLRVVGCGSEPIRVEALTDFQRTFARCGLKPEVLVPCYGLAEATLAVTFDSVTEPYRTLRLDARRIMEDGVVERVEDSSRPALEYVCCGRPIDGCEVRIDDPEGNALPDGRVGRIMVRSASQADGYFDNEAETRRVFRDGWIDTGDLGLMVDGRLWVTGRQKELVIVNGQNCHPHDVEEVVRTLPRVRKGGVVAFARPGRSTEELVIAAETSDYRDDAGLRDGIRAAVRRSIGLPVADVVLLRPQSIPKTTSGKLQRSLARAMYLERSGPFQHDARARTQSAARAVVRYAAKSMMRSWMSRRPVPEDDERR